MAAVSAVLEAQNNHYRISGVVMDAIHQQPMAKILVQISPVRQRDHSQAVITDTQGAFAFTDLVPGKYTLSAGRSSESLHTYGGEDGFSTAIAVGPDQNSEHIVFSLPPSGSLNGTVFDEEGSGMRNAQVSLFWQHVLSGRKEITYRGSAITASSGRFHFGGLSPGRYYLAVYARPWYAQGCSAKAEMAREFDVAYPVTYYPDVTEFASASPITVTRGASNTIQMTLRLIPAAHANLANFQSKPGSPAVPALWVLGPGGHRISVGPSLGSVNDRLELCGISPGRYEMQVLSLKGGSLPLLATKTVDLTTDSEVDLATIIGSMVTGQVTLADNTPVPKDLQIYLAQVGGGTLGQAPVSQSGSFRISGQDLPPGRYQISLRNAPGFVIQSVRAQGATWKNGLLELADTSSIQLFLQLATASATLDGMALLNKQPFAGATVLLLPTEADRADLIRRAQSDSDGTFTLSNVLPGQYRLLAINNGHDLAYADPAVIKPYLSVAQTVTVNAGKQSALSVNVQTRLSSEQEPPLDESMKQ